MAKEPKLLAEIRENRARAEKDAKAAKARGDTAPQSGPQMTATVVTPEKSAPLNNYLAGALNECTSAEHCEELLEHAKAHGYSEEGQTVKQIRARLAELGGGARKTATKATAKKRGGAR